MVPAACRIAERLAGSRHRVDRRRADVNARGPDGSTPLVRATLWRHVDVVRVLLSGVQSATVDERGWTALGVALQIEHRELADLLRRHMR